MEIILLISVGLTSNCLELLSNPIHFFLVSAIEFSKIYFRVNMHKL